MTLEGVVPLAQAGWGVDSSPGERRVRLLYLPAVETQVLDLGRTGTWGYFLGPSEPCW